VPSKLDVRCGGKGCEKLIGRQTQTGLCQKCYNLKRATPIVIKPVQQIAADRDKVRSAAVVADLTKKYKESLKTIERQEHELHATRLIDSSIDTFSIQPLKGAGTSEATPVLVASDWHVEENVKLATVSGLNKYTLEIAKQRATKFFQSGLRLIQLLNQDTSISTVVLALLGDFVTNDIHEELKDLTELQPILALAAAESMLVSGIQFLLDHSKYNFVIPCHSGNHARTTKTTHFSAENGHSLEYLMYLHLAAYFRHEKRLLFIIPDGYHSYVQVYDQTIRFHHGHAIKYGGGVGGIFIPTFKAISQWSKAKHADLDIFGHFHQMKDGGNFISNGSLIGYNGFALSIKADFETPRQALFLMDKKRGRTCTWPVLVS
jgi:hypothetical protein